MEAWDVLIGQCSIRKLHRTAATSFSRSTSCLQGQRSQGQNDLDTHTYPSFVVHIPKLTSVARICWIQKQPQDFQGQGHIYKANCRGDKMACLCTFTIRGSATYTNLTMQHQHFGYSRCHNIFPWFPHHVRMYFNTSKVKDDWGKLTWSCTHIPNLNMMRYTYPALQWVFPPEQRPITLNDIKWWCQMKSNDDVKWY